MDIYKNLDKQTDEPETTSDLSSNHTHIVSTILGANM